MKARDRWTEMGTMLDDMIEHRERLDPAEVRNDELDMLKTIRVHHDELGKIRRLSLVLGEQVDEQD